MAKFADLLYFDNLYKQFLYDTVPSEESDSNIEIEFAERASPNRESDVIEVEENGNAVVEKEVTPPEKKQKKIRTLSKLVRNQNK